MYCSTSLTESISAKNGAYRLFIAGDDEEWVPVLLVVSKGASNPLDFPDETRGAIHKFSAKHGLSLENSSVILDLTEYMGIRVPCLFRWDLSSSSFGPLNLKDLPLKESIVVKEYYKDHLSLLVSSMLTSDEKAELVASILANTIYDKTSAERVHASIALRLFDSLENCAENSGKKSAQEWYKTVFDDPTS